MNIKTIQNPEHENDPFSPAADPYPPKADMPASIGDDDGAADKAQHACHCSNGMAMSRRQAMFGLSLLATAPVIARAEATLVPCFQASQTVSPCHHKFCRYYIGKDDYYGR